MSNDFGKYLLLIIPVSYKIIPVLIAVTLHEAAHAYAAYLMGDDTAKMHGRLTLNPIRHLDPFGSFLFPILLILVGLPVFGYAKPVPVNPFRYRHFRAGTVFVSSAGVIANLMCAALSGLLFQFLRHHFPGIESVVLQIILQILQYSVIINVVLMVFNLIPLPPLDGSRIVGAMLPLSWQMQFERVERYGMIILIILIVTDTLDKLFDFFVNPLTTILLGR